MIDLGAYARMHAMVAYSHNLSDGKNDSSSSLPRIALLAFFDFATAFPSVARAWLFLVTHATGTPSWFIHFVEAFYAPLFLHHFEESLSRKNAGIICVCADDIGASIDSLVHIKLVFEVFNLAESVANILLKPKKYNLIPTNLPCTPSLIQQIKDWLKEHAPSWVSFQVVPRAKYLGFFRGPLTQDIAWNDVFSKFASRCRAVRYSKCGPSIAAFSYNFTMLFL